jgi:hypothetical protein
MSAQSQIFNPTLRTSQASGDGFSCPVMNTASRLTLNFGVSDKGMMVYDTTLANVMYWTGTVWLPLGGGAVPVGASLNTEVIYNNAGVLEGDAGLTFNNATNALTAGGFNVTGATIPANGVYLGAANNLSFSAASTVGMTLDASGNLLVALTSALANGKLQVAGSIGLSGNTQIRQATNADGNSLTVLATQLVAGSLNSSSYGYAGNGLVASVGAADGALLLDVGRITSTDGRFKVSNSSVGDIQMSLEKNGVYTLSADTGSGNVTVGTGNVVMGTSGRGIDFSATAGTGTSELLADYEEGTWTPTDSSGAALAFVLTKCRYTKIGRAVTIQGRIQYPITVSAAPAGFQSFPFVSADMLPLFIAYDGSGTIADSLFGLTTFVGFYLAGTPVLNSALSGVAVNFSGTYMT